MKKTLITTLLLAAAVGAFAQGSINFGNQFGSGFISPIYNVDPANPANVVRGNSATSRPVGNPATVYAGGLLQGSGFTMGLFVGAAGTPVNQLHLASTAAFRSGTGGANALPAGLITSQLALVIQGIEAGAPAQLEIRAWDNRGGTVSTWDAVLANPSVARGTSGTFLSGGLGGIDSSGNPVIPPNTSGWQSFGLYIVPEPSTIALAVLGFGSLLLFRRRK